MPTVHRQTPVPVDPAWPDHELTTVAALVRERAGRDVVQLDRTFLARSLERRRVATGLAGSGEYMARLAADPAELTILIASLDVHHSEFFRDPILHALLEERVLPGLALRKDAEGGSEIRVWSAGCAAGQEAYSVAATLLELAEAWRRPVRFRIFATDVSPEQVALARAGRYADTSVRNVRLRQLRRWFEPEGTNWVVGDALRMAVDFSVHDLLDPAGTCPPASIFGAFDLVLCCNVLYYYRSDVQRRIVDRLQACLRPEGFLATGDAERDVVLSSGAFQPSALPSSLFTRWR